MSIEPYLLFGRLCLKAKLFTAKELRTAVTKQFNDQKEGKKKLFGEVCIELGLITEEQRDEILKKQASEEIHPEATVFGQLAVLNGFITKKQITDVLRTQKDLRAKGDKKRIGEILYSEKLMAPIQVRSILKAQHRIRQGMRSTMYLSREFVDKEADKAEEALKTPSVESIDADDLAVTKDKKVEKKKAKKKRDKTDKNVEKSTETAQPKPKKPSIDEIEDRLKNLENDFGGMFEVSIDEDDAIDVVDESTDDDDGVIEPKLLDDEFNEDVFKIRKEDQEQRRTDQQKLREESIAVGAEQNEIKDVNTFIDKDAPISKHPTEYLADNIVFEQYKEDEEEDTTMTRREKEFLDTNISEASQSQIEIIKSDGTTIKPVTEVRLDSGVKPIPVDQNDSSKSTRKEASSDEEGKKLRFRGRVFEEPNSLEVKLQKKVPYLEIFLIAVAIILLSFTAFVIITHSMK